MTHGRKCMIPVALIVAMATTICLTSCEAVETQTSAGGKSAGPSKVELRKTAEKFQLYVNNQPFFIKGAGGEGSLAKLKAAGGNSIRTWGIDRLQSVLDEAQKQGLTVCVGIWFQHEEDKEGFNYSNPEMVKAQLEQVRQCVLRFKDHPAVLLWGLGNEMEGYKAGNKAEIWNAVNDAAKLTKQLDPNHPTMTVISELGGERVACVHRYCPDIDIVGINTYAGGPSIATRYAKQNGTKPYIVTEFGPPGPWEIGKTSWNAPREPTSTEKSEWYRRAYKGSIEEKPLCLGSYAFLWGQKQETTVTWYGMFLKDGAKLSAVDTMTELWTGAPPTNRCPAIKQLKIRDLREFAPGDTFSADLEATDPDGQPLQVRWVVQPEQTNRLSGGIEEPVLPELTDIIVRSDIGHAEVRAPEQPGGYRLFVYVRNGAGAAVANVPFRVASTNKAGALWKTKPPLLFHQAQADSRVRLKVPRNGCQLSVGVQALACSRYSSRRPDTLKRELQRCARAGSVGVQPLGCPALNQEELSAWPNNS